MQGQKIVRKTVSILFKVVLYLCLFFVVGYISYRVTLLVNGGKNSGSLHQNSTESGIVAARTDTVALNAIFGVDENTAQVESIVLEVFNTNTKNIDLITVPASTKVTMSQELYAKMAKANPNIPQIITLSDIGKYFEQEVAYEYATLVLNEFLNTDISFYSALLKKNFDQYFVESSDMYTFRNDVVQEWKAYTESSQYLEAMIKYYEQVQSNLKLAQRKTYIPNYLNANYDYIHTYLVKEEYTDGGYKLSSEQQNLLQSIMSYEDTYTSDKDVMSETLGQGSKEASIQILNGTNVSGLAAKYKTRLEEAGYTIGSIGNYTGESLESTKILVKEDGLGMDLENYFTSPVIETETIEGGYDILIILGNKDA